MRYAVVTNYSIVPLFVTLESRGRVRWAPLGSHEKSASALIADKRRPVASDTPTVQFPKPASFRTSGPRDR